MSKPVISLIAALDAQFGIGKDQQLLCYLPADLQHFKARTMGKSIVMGRKTFASLGKPLPGRRNIILSRQGLAYSGIAIASSVEEVFQLCAGEPEIMIIGGSEIYREFLPLADYLHITHIQATFDADVFFPRWDPKAWTQIEIRKIPADEKNKYAFDVALYKRISK